MPLDKSELPKCREVSREELLSKFLTDDSLNDISLEGKDGVKVRANRRILAARSEVFHKMLLGEFLEASSPNVRVGYNGIVLRAIVEYIHTDTAHILDFVKEEGSDVTLGDMVRIQGLVSLAGASAYFIFPGLCGKTYDCLDKILKEFPSLSMAVLEACTAEGPSVPKQLGVLALSQIDYTTFKNMNASALALVSPSTLQAILQDDYSNADEYQLFQLLQLWKDAVETHPSAEAYPFSNQDSRRIASELAKYIHLDWIDPKILSMSVKSSGLVTHEQLLEAYEIQALAAREQHGFASKKRRMRSFKWLSSKSEVSSSRKAFHEVDLLDCPPLTSGISKWTIEIEEKANTWIGVSSTESPLGMNMATWLGGRNGGWVFSDSGVAYHAKSRVKSGLPKFSNGDKVTVTLDLTEENSGTLTSSVNGAASVEIFSELRTHLKGRGGGFVPAVSQYTPGCIRLLDFEQLRG